MATFSAEIKYEYLNCVVIKNFIRVIYTSTGGTRNTTHHREILTSLVNVSVETISKDDKGTDSSARIYVKHGKMDRGFSLTKEQYLDFMEKFNTGINL